MHTPSTMCCFREVGLFWGGVRFFANMISDVGKRCWLKDYRLIRVEMCICGQSECIPLLNQETFSFMYRSHSKIKCSCFHCRSVVIALRFFWITNELLFWIATVTNLLTQLLNWFIRFCIHDTHHHRFIVYCIHQNVTILSDTQTILLS